MEKNLKRSNELVWISTKCKSVARGQCWVVAFASMIIIMGSANGQKIDSLKSLLEVSAGGKRCDVLYQIAYEFIDNDNNMGLRYAKQAFEAAMAIGDSLRIVRAGRIKSMAYRRLGELDSSLVLSIKMLGIADRNGYNGELKPILNALALVYTHKANYDKALKHYFHSLNLDDESNDVWIALNNIGLVYYKLADYDKALAYYQQSLSRTENDKEIAIVMINMSLCYAYKNDFSLARKYVRQALEKCSNNCPKQTKLSASFCQGYISFGLKEMDSAEMHFIRSYKLSKELQDERYQLDNLTYLFKIYLQAREIEEAKKLVEEAEELIFSGVAYNQGLIQLYFELFNLYMKMGDFQKVARYQTKYIQLKDSIYSEELTNNLMQVESEYLERENTAKIETQSRILALNEELIFRQRILNAFTGIVTLLLSVLIYIIYRNYRQKRAANLVLEQKVKERTEELQKNNEALMHALEEQMAVFQKVSLDVKSSMATIKGLCALELSDTEASYGSQYIERIVATSDQLLGNVTRTLGPKSPK